MLYCIKSNNLLSPPQPPSPQKKYIETSFENNQPLISKKKNNWKKNSCSQNLGISLYEMSGNDELHFSVKIQDKGISLH